MDDDRTWTAMLVLSQMFFTVFGSLANIFVFIILRDLPSLSSSTYNILLLNLTAANLIVCTIVKPMSSVFVSYSFAEVIDKFYIYLSFSLTRLPQTESVVSLEFCTLYSALHWLTLPVCPLTLFTLSWHLFLSSRRADERALKVPKHATSIFLMMIPLATAWFDSLKPVQHLQSADFSSALEQKRRNVKSVRMREGPRPRQKLLLATIWTFSALISVERILMRKTEREPITREYLVRPDDSSAKEIR